MLRGIAYPEMAHVITNGKGPLIKSNSPGMKPQRARKLLNGLGILVDEYRSERHGRYYKVVMDPDSPSVFVCAIE